MLPVNTRHAFLILGCIFTFLSACTPPKSEYRTTLFSFGTLIDITLRDVTQEQADEAFSLLEKNFQNDHHNWSPWENGDLAAINRKLANKETAILPDKMIPMIKQAIDLSKQSQGLFNPTIGLLINLWQFHKHDDPDIKPPDDDAIQQLLKMHPHVENLSLNGNTLTTTNPSVQLSLGAFAKGYGIQKALDSLKSLGIHNAIINAGGDLGVIGMHGNREWNIGIRHPRQDTAIASVEIKNGENIFTSGDYERFYFYQGKRYHHILDPTTGYPAEGFSSVTVIDNNAAVADAAATALLVAGKQKWLEIARAMHLHYILLVDDNNNIIMNPKMAARAGLAKSGIGHIIISEPL